MFDSIHKLSIDIDQCSFDIDLDIHSQTCPPMKSDIVWVHTKGTLVNINAHSENEI